MFEIRDWAGSQASAWEELAYQLREDPAPGVVETRRTRAPDAGTEWYDVYDDGHEEGYQAKFYESLSDALGGMRESVEAVARHRSAMTRLTFVVPFNLTDNPGLKTDQQRWDEAKDRWARDIDGAERLEIELVRGSDVLERLALERHRGRRAFWFGEFELTQDRLRGWWERARAGVGDRYTPEADTPLGLETIPDTLTVSDELREDVRTRLDELTDAFGQARALDIMPAGWNADLDDVPISLSDAPIGEWDPALQAVVSWTEGMTARLEDVDATNSASEDRATLARLQRAVSEVRRSAAGRWWVAGPGQCLVLEGRGGVGKTHFVMDAVRGLLDDWVPALAALGGRFSNEPWWPSLAAQLAVDVEPDVFFGALDAMAEARGRRALLVIDAINESEQPWGWRTELPDLAAYVRRFDHLALLVTCREEYTTGIVREGVPDMPVARHPGAWRARREMFDAYESWLGAQVPERLKLDPAFDNPLLIKLACQAYASDAPPTGDLARNDLFRSWVADRSRRIVQALRLAPDSPAVLRAVAMVASRALLSPRLEVARDDVEADIDALIPQDGRGWPWTLFAQLKEAGLIDVVPAANDQDVVRFPYESLSNFLLVDHLLGTADPHGAVAPEEVLARRPKLWPAASSLLPEHGVGELTTFLTGHALPDDAPDLDMLFIRSLLHRRSEAITGETEQEFARLLTTRAPVEPFTVDVAFQLATHVDHPFNADWLHTQLASLEMAERDAAWGIGAYDAHDEPSFDEVTAVLDDREAGQAARRLALLACSWLLESPNRPMRDRLTKTLRSAASDDLPLVTETLRAFVGVDAPYTLERLLLVAYGALMLSDEDAEGRAELVDVVVQHHARDEWPTNILVADHLRGIAAWASAHGLADEDVAAETGRLDCEPPQDPPSEGDLRVRHDFDAAEPAGTILASGTCQPF